MVQNTHPLANYVKTKLAMVNLAMCRTLKDNQPPYLALFLCPQECIHSMPVELSKGKHISCLLFWKEENNLHAFKIDHLKVRIEKLQEGLGI